MAGPADADYTLSKLIEDLQAQLAEHGDVPVKVEGCDCTDFAHSVAWQDFEWPSGMRERNVLIERAPGTH